MVATCNNITSLPPEFYLPCFGLATDQHVPPDADFTGAEIRSCCRLAALLDVSLVEAAQNVVPVARAAGESVTKLREWASGRRLSADHKGLYRFGSDGAGEKRRSIPRDPSVN